MKRILLLLVMGSALACGSIEEPVEPVESGEPLVVNNAMASAPCSAAQAHKVTICHVPPGNPLNARTLCISENAVGAHVDHHADYVGPCDWDDDDGDDDDDSRTPVGASIED